MRDAASPLYAIVDADVCARAGRAPLDVARAFLAGGARWCSCAPRRWRAAPFLDLANAMLEDANAAGGDVIVNDRADIAALSGAPGLHVGQDDLAPARCARGDRRRRRFSASRRTPRSSGSGAASEPISYLAIGPVFGTGTKDTGYEAVGLETVRRASDRGRAQRTAGGGDRRHHARHRARR